MGIARYYRAARMLRSIGVDIQVDHFVALRGKEACGLHVPDNLRLSFAGPNKSKREKLVSDEHLPGPLPGQFQEIPCPT